MRPERMVMFDQRMSLMDRGQTLYENYRRLNPGSNDNDARAALARFSFRGEGLHGLPAVSVEANCCGRHLPAFWVEQSFPNF